MKLFEHALPNGDVLVGIDKKDKDHFLSENLSCKIETGDVRGTVLGSGSVSCKIIGTFSDITEDQARQWGFIHGTGRRIYTAKKHMERIIISKMWANLGEFDSLDEILLIVVKK